MPSLSLSPEYSFGGHDVPNITGVFEVRPRSAQALRFRCDVPSVLKLSLTRSRESLSLGECSLTKEEVDTIVDELSADWMGLSYHSLYRYC